MVGSPRVPLRVARGGVPSSSINREHHLLAPPSPRPPPPVSSCLARVRAPQSYLVEAHVAPERMKKELVKAQWRQTEKFAEIGRWGHGTKECVR